MDAVYKEFPMLFRSAGVTARLLQDTASTEQYLALTNCEETYENAFSQRLGSLLLTAQGTVGQPVYPLSGICRSLFKLGQLGGLAYRYCVTSDGALWRISGLNPGSWTKISTSFSGNPCSIQSYSNTDYTSTVTAFFADANGFFKDTGTQSAPSQGGIFPPQFPVIAQSQEPTTLIPIDNYQSGTGGYAFSGITGGTIISPVSTTLTSAVTAIGIQSVTVADPTQPGLFQLLTVDTGGSQETVLVLLVTPTGFVAEFTKVHSSGVSVSNQSLSMTVPASTTATVSLSFGGYPIPSSETVYGNQADYIGLYLYVSDPNQIQSITLKFDCGDGSFNTDYFYKTIAQGPLQAMVAAATTPEVNLVTILTGAVQSESLNLYGPQPGGIAQLNTGLAAWTPLLFQLSDFAGSGRADYSDPVYNWANVNGYQIQIVSNDNTSVTVNLAALVLFGGAGPDTLGGVAYDYVWTFLNPVDGTESNPSPVMTNQNPPNATNWVYPRRQPVLLNMNVTTYGPSGQLQDGQIGYLVIYRRGGTLGDNYRQVDQILVNISSGGIVRYIDTAPDYLIAGADIVSFTNDVPVPSLLPVPVNTILANAINVAGQVVTVTPVSMANISVRQKVTLGSPTAQENNFETVVVLTVGSSSFTAFVQNTHSIAEQVQASIVVGQPLPGMVIAFNKAWYWGDPNNPSTLYFSEGDAPQYVGEANNLIISTPDDYITTVVPYKGNLYVSCIKSGWWMVPPGNPTGQPPYPTACKHGCVAMFGAVATEEMIVYQSADGIRAFAGGASEYLTQTIEFIFQGVGTTPIVEANQSLLSQTVMAYWNNQVFISYVGTDGNRHRVIYHAIYKRWRNDDFDCQSIFLESDTNQLVVGDSNGLVHVDRQDVGYDQINSGGVLAAGPININLQTAYSFGDAPNRQKQYSNLQVDVNTAGQDLTFTLLFNDGQSSIVLGTANTTEREKVNFSINEGDGFQAYKVSLQVTGSLTSQAYIYQCAIEALTLPVTRRSIDIYQLRLGIEDSKFAKNIWWEYTATAPITFSVYYDSNPTAGFTFTLPVNGGIRNPLRTRLPAISFRDIRIVGYSTGDFMVWSDSKIEFKPQASGKGYQTAEFVTN